MSYLGIGQLLSPGGKIQGSIAGAERTSFLALILHTPHVASPIPASATMVFPLQFAGRDHHPPIICQITVRSRREPVKEVLNRSERGKKRIQSCAWV
jgi:hypothetical protein